MAARSFSTNYQLLCYEGQQIRTPRAIMLLHETDTIKRTERTWIFDTASIHQSLLSHKLVYNGGFSLFGIQPIRPKFCVLPGMIYFPN